MRALLLLLLGVAGVWALIKFYPQSTEAGGPADGGGGATVVQPNPIDDGSASLGGSGDADPERAELVDDGPDVATTSPPSVSQGSYEGPQPDAARLGQTVAHGSADDVERFLAQSGIGVDAPRGRMALAYAQALEGRRAEAAELARPLSDSGAIGEVGRELLARALGQAAGRSIPAAARRTDPLERAMIQRYQDRQVSRLMESNDWAAAARLYSDLLRSEIDAPWPASRALMTSWTQGLKRAQGHHRWNPRGSWPALEVPVQSGDTLTGIRVRVLQENPDMLLCTGLIERANRKEGRFLQPDEVLRVPTDQAHCVVDLSARWVLYYLGDEVADAWMVAVGAQGSETYLGDFHVDTKQEEPMWFPGPGMDPLPFGHPENPLGTRWIGWSWEDGTPTSLGFHGTDEPETVGEAASAGCIRMRNEDVEVLFRILPRGASIHVQP